MTATPELAQYVMQARQAGLSDEAIRSELFRVGWSTADIDLVLPQPVASPSSTPSMVAPAVEPPSFSGQNVAALGRKSHIPFIITVFLLLITGGTVYYFLPQIVGVVMRLSSKLEQVVPLQNVPVNNTTITNNVLPISNQKDCGTDFNCLIDAAKTCTPAKVEITTTVDLSAMFGVPSSSPEPHIIQTQRSIAEIKGITNGKCVLWTKLVDVQNPDMPTEIRDAALKDGEMTCSYDSADLAVRLKNVQEGNTSFSFSTEDTPEQKAAKQCRNYGASLEQSRATQQPSASVPKYNHVIETSIGEGSDYTDGVTGLTIRALKIWDGFAQINVTSNKSQNEQSTLLYVGKNTTAFDSLIELESINLNSTGDFPKQIKLKISSNAK